MEPPFSHAGELAALATACCWMASSLAFQGAGRRVGSLPVNLIRLIMALVPLGAYTWVTRGSVLPMDASPRAWMWLSLSGLVGFAVGDLCLFRAFVLVGARISMLIIPVSMIIYREHIAWQAAVGAAVAVCGSALLFL
jgi:drug/metabolite transporter (DMT)-like permease